MTAPTPEPNPATQEDQRLAMADEERAAMESTLTHFQQRVVALNVEVRHRDRRIAELEQEKAAAERGRDAMADANTGETPEPVEG